MKNDLENQIWLILDNAAHKLRRAAFLATGEPYKKEIREIIENITKIKENLAEKLDKK
tara:strand:- start:3025 stop:3198 length:174 start_codon:yes stop_codon:yes gene_type:complete